MWTTTALPPGPRSLDHVRQDPSLNDEQLETEIKLVGDLVLAASQAEGPLSDDQIDELLGVAPDDADAQRVRAEVNEARKGHERSLMARGIYSWAAHESRRRLDDLGG